MTDSSITPPHAEGASVLPSETVTIAESTSSSDVVLEVTGNGPVTALEQAAQEILPQLEKVAEELIPVMEEVVYPSFTRKP